MKQQTDPRAQTNRNSAIQRPPELQDWLNRKLYHPLAWRLAKSLEGGFVTPNMLSLAGLSWIVIAAAFYSAGSEPIWVLLGLASHMAWHIFDGADGDLARLTQKASPLGEVIDGLCDYVGHLVLYLCLGFILHSQIGAVAWPIMLTAAFARIIQANFYEVQRRQYQWWTYDVPWVGGGNPPLQLRSGAFGMLVGIYLQCGAIMATGGRDVDAALAQMDEAKRNHAKAVIAKEYAPFLNKISILSANYRTLALAASMLVGSPIYFFLFEALILSAALAALIGKSRKLITRILNQLEVSSSR